MMTSNKPYLVRALYEWLVDNDATPYILVDANFEQVMIPSGIARDGQVVLNIAQRAVQGLVMENSHIAFSARFGGVSQNLYIPMQAVLAIYSMEDGEGMMFAEEVQAASTTESDQASEGSSKNQTDKKIKNPGLKIVK